MAQGATLKFSSAVGVAPSCEVRSPSGIPPHCLWVDERHPAESRRRRQQRQGNPALVENARAFTLHKEFGRLAPTPESRRAIASRQRSTKKWSRTSRPCSTRWVTRSSATGAPVFHPLRPCQGRTEGLKLPTTICETCGTPTIPCVAPGCATWRCVAADRSGCPAIAPSILTESPASSEPLTRSPGWRITRPCTSTTSENLARATRVVAVAGIGAGVLATVAVSAAARDRRAHLQRHRDAHRWHHPVPGPQPPATASPCSAGGAASGGALAFGVTGGTCVVTVVGAALGGALGTSITNAYLSEDKSFSIEVPATARHPGARRPGMGSPRTARMVRGQPQAVERRYPDSPSLSSALGQQGQKHSPRSPSKGKRRRCSWGGAFAVSRKASKSRRQEGPAPRRRAGRSGGRRIPGTPLWSVPTRPACCWQTSWHARRSTVASWSLQSQRSRVSITAAETLGTDPDAPASKPCTLSAAAKKGDWRPTERRGGRRRPQLSAPMTKVPEIAYRTAQWATNNRPVRIRDQLPQIHDHEVTDRVSAPHRSTSGA